LCALLNARLNDACRHRHPDVRGEIAAREVAASQNPLCRRAAVGREEAAGLYGRAHGSGWANQNSAQPAEALGSGFADFISGKTELREFVALLALGANSYKKSEHAIPHQVEETPGLRASPGRYWWNLTDIQVGLCAGQARGRVDNSTGTSKQKYRD